VVLSSYPFVPLRRTTRILHAFDAVITLTPTAFSDKAYESSEVEK